MFNTRQLLFICILINAFVWRDFTNKIRVAYEDMVEEGVDIGFVEAEMVNDCWVKLNIKSSDVENGKHFVSMGSQFILLRKTN